MIYFALGVGAGIIIGLFLGTLCDAMAYARRDKAMRRVQPMSKQDRTVEELLRKARNG